MESVTSKIIYSKETKGNILNLQGQRRMMEEQLKKCSDHLQIHPDSSQANLAYYTGRIAQIDYTIDLLKGFAQEPVKPIFDIKVEVKIELPDEEDNPSEKTGQECEFNCECLGIKLMEGKTIGDCKKCPNTPPF